jgi:16S rRNA G527 N7-methylase RsmG
MNNTYDVAFARAVSDPSTVWGISEQLLKSKGRLIFFLSTQPDNSARKRELQNRNLEGISWQIEDVRIPKLNSSHKILVMDKQ